MVQAIVRPEGMKSKDVYWELYPPFFLSKCVGVCPMDKKFRLNKPHLAHTIFLLTFMLMLGTYLAIFMESTKGLFEMSAFSLLLERAELIIVVLSVVVSAGKSITNIGTLSRVVRDISFLDKKLYEVGILFSYSRLYGSAISLMKICLILSICLSDLFFLNSVARIEYVVAQYILIMPPLVGNLVEVQFMALLEIIQRRIKVMIEKLKDVSIGMNFTKPHHLQVLASVHSSLLTSCEIINELYSPQILIILSSIFIVTTANLYHVIEKLISFMTKKKYSDLNFVLITFYRVSVRSLEVWTLVRTCVNTQEVAKEFNTLLYQIMIDDKSNDIANNKKLRLHVSMKRDIVFTAYGFFTLDYTLVHSMIAAATTYLVILIQFGQPTSVSDSQTTNATSIMTSTESGEFVTS